MVGFVEQGYCRREVGCSVAFLVAAELDEPPTEYALLFHEETVEWMSLIVQYVHQFL